MSQTKAQLISDLVQALNFTGTSSAPANGMYLSAANTISLSTNSAAERLTISSTGESTFGGPCTINSGTNTKLILSGSNDPELKLYEGTTSKVQLQWDSTNGLVYFWNEETNTGFQFGAVAKWYDGSAYQLIWHAGNDGSGSGLDADTCDGQHLGTTTDVQFGRLNAQKGITTAPSLLVGANSGGSGMNNNSSKHANICCPQYLSDTQTGGFRLLSAYGNDGANYCYIGGNDDNITGTATHPKNATELRLFTSATATGNGVERLRIDSSGVSTFAGKIAINTVARIESTGEFKAAHGTEATPSYNFLNDNDNGMYRITTNEIGFSTGGTKALTLHSDQKATFEGGVGIKMASGGSTLGINGNIYLAAGGNTSWAKAALKGSNNTTGSDLSINNWGDAEGDYWTIGVNSTSNASGNTAKTNTDKRSVSVLLDGRMGRMVLETSQTSTATRDTTHTWDRSGDYTLTGNIILADTKGINFAATGGPASGSGGSEILNDYEQGTFTPAWFDDGGNFVTSYSTQYGQYTKIGNVVYFCFGLRIGTFSRTPNADQKCRVGNLPYASRTVADDEEVGFTLYARLWGSGTPPKHACVRQATDSNHVDFYMEESQAGNDHQLKGEDFDSSATCRVIVSGFYYTS